MILRKFPYVLLGLLTLTQSNAEEDKNDWIPIAQPCTDCKDEAKLPVVEKKAQGRVLNLADPPEANFFPEEQNKVPRGSYQQFLRETTSLYQNQKRPQHRLKQPAQHPYRFESPPPPPPPPVHPGRQQRPQLQKQEPSQQYFLHQPKQEYLNAPQFAQPPQPPQYFTAPQEYHTIPEEYLAQQGLQQGNLPYFQQNYQTLPSIPDLPPIRLNTSISTIHAINHELVAKKKPTKHVDITSTTPKGEKENVQLLYVPLEALNHKHQKDLPRLHAYQQAPVPEVHQQFVNFRPQYNNQQVKIHDIENDFIRQALEAHKLQQQFQEEQQPYALPIIDTTLPPTTTTTTTTTRRPPTKKRKPHQPPLAVYMGGDKNAEIGDVLTILKDAKTIDVQDSVGPNSPKIFVGPSTLDPPTGYAKFELPYLSSIDNNRVERKVDQLPFFVAPLSYKTPPGYSKIPLPSPHVGSVVVSNKQKLQDSDAIPKPLYTLQNQHTDFRPYQVRQHNTEEVSKRPVLTSTPKYSRPIPEEHVINQYELDQINSFLPQYQVQQQHQVQQQQVQQAPEKYSFDTFQPQYPPEYQQQFEQYQEQLLQQPKLPVQQFKQQEQYKYSSEEQPKPTQSEPKEQKQKPKTYVSTIPSPTQNVKLHYPSTQTSKQYVSYPSSTTESSNEESKENIKEEKYSYEPGHKTRPLNSQEQFTEEVIPDDKNTYDSVQQTRNTHPRLSSTPAPHGQYLKEVVSEDNYSYEDIITQPRPTHVRTRPSSTVAPQYYTSLQTRPTGRRTRPTTTPPTPHEQYIKETVHTRQRQSTTPSTRQQHVQQYGEEVPDIRYHLSSTPAAPVRSTTPVLQQYLTESVTPKEQLYSPRPTFNSIPSSSKEPSSLYSPRPTHLTYTDFDSREKVKYVDESKSKPAIETSEEDEESAAHQRYQASKDGSGEQYVVRQGVVYSSTQNPGLQNQHILNQEVLDRKILGQPQQDSANYITETHLYRQNGVQHDDREEPLVHRTRTQYYDEPKESHEIKTQNANVENYNLPGQLSPTNQVLPSLINNLEDQSIRQLLHPGLVPTSVRGDYEVGVLSSTYPPPPPPPITTTTTQAPTTYPTTEALTTKKSRGRQRGNRYSSTTPSSVTRKTSQRGRRPLPPRPKYQDDSSTEYSSRTTTDPTKKIINSRSRFRARTRPPQSEATAITDRVSTERHYYDENVHVAPIQEHSSTARILDTRQGTYRIQPVDEEYAVSYQPIYNLPTEHSHVVPVQKILNVEVSRPANEPVIIQEINQLPIRNLEEHHETSTTNRPSRSRPRVRGRPRTSTTETASTEPPRRQEISSERSSDDEFYGFFREPNFKKPATEVPEETEAPQKPVYSSTYVSSTLKPLLQYADDPYVRSSSVRYEENPSTPVHFVGEIRPKYQSSTSEFYEVTQSNLPSEVHYQSTPREVNDPNKVKIRGRIRVPSRRITTEEATPERQRTNNDLSSREESTSRAPQRVRTRGKVHFKPQNKRKDSSEDEDVEGGNYPPQFRAVGPQSSTPRPSFQITVDPPVDDQEPYPSIYRPTYVAKETGSKEDGHLEASIGVYKSSNDLPSDEKSEVPTALPVVSAEVQTVINETNLDTLEKLIHELSNAPQEDEKEVETENEEVHEDEIKDDVVTTISPDDVTTKKGRRRGVWKLVKRPIDVLEGAESQHLSTVNANSFDNDEKDKHEGKTHILGVSKEVTEEIVATTILDVEESTTPIPSSTEGSFFNSLYEMFGITGNEDALKDVPAETTTDKKSEEITTITEDKDVITQEPTEPDVITTTHTNHDESKYSTTPAPMTYVTPMSLESWNLGIIKTSTSTEISHETEICYKGRCIKSKDMKVPAT